MKCKVCYQSDIYKCGIQVVDIVLNVVLNVVLSKRTIQKIMRMNK